MLGYFLIISSLLIVDRYLVTDSPNFPNLTEICIIDNEITTMSECYDIMINGL
ncbi:hypothetical protein GM3709_682 [Geminocystis sp. NIES-3709]|nr:hypothetical protein GM3709_682 [Geminocystis sp. NIES-3709]